MLKTNMSTVKAWFRWCPVKEREQFKNSRCLMPISIGQSVHEGDKLCATLKRINSSFKECTILIDDTIQRHTVKLTLPSSFETSKEENFIYKKCLDEGDEWLKRNSYLISSLDIPVKIIRWDKWLFHKNYPSQRAIIDGMYKTNKEYENSINETINLFLERYLKRNEIHISYEQAFIYCLEYIKEECTALCLWVEENCEFEVYPSGRNKAMIATYNLLIKPNYPLLLRSVGLYFKKSKNDKCSFTQRSIINEEIEVC